MGANWYDYNTRYARQHLREMQAEAAKERLARQARPARRALRHNLGVLLISAGEVLAR